MFVRSFLFIIVAFVFLFIISWQLTLLMVASILPVMVFSVVYGKFMKKAQKIVQDRKAQISSIAEETFSNVRTVKAFATESDEALRFSEGNKGVYDIGYSKAVWYGAFNFVANFFVFGSMAAILIAGAKLCQDGKLTIGEVTAFLFYMMQILINFMILASVLGSVMSIIGASHKVVELLEYEPKINTTGGIIPEAGTVINGEISLRNVRFNYPTKKDVEVLKGISIDIQKNKVIALVGPSGKH
jgi:ATP-binding cassette subfamily B protein